MYRYSLSLGLEGTNVKRRHISRVGLPPCRSIAIPLKPQQVVDYKVVARDGIEPPTPAFSGPPSNYAKRSRISLCH
jgi:hypothetical protein